MICNIRFEESDELFDTKFSESNEAFDVDFSDVVEILSGDVPKYKGEYVVTPRVAAQTLYTAQKYLEQDVVINKIPYFEVTNNSGGKTASIGDV